MDVLLDPEVVGNVIVIVTVLTLSAVADLLLSRWRRKHQQK